MYLQLYNVFSMEGNKYHLSMKELFVYSLLKRRMDFAYSTITTIDVLIQLFDKQGINIHNKQSEKRKRIKYQLQSLQDKGVIKIEGDYSKNNELLEISFPDVTANGKGFAQIEFSTFDNINNVPDLYIYYVVARFNNGKNEYKVPFNCDDKRWSRILGVKSITTVRAYIDHAIDSGLIYKNSGDYNTERARKGQNGQDISQYKIVPFTKDEKSNMQRKKERKNNPTPDIESIGNSDYPFDTGNWKVKGKVELTVDDYVIYLEHKRKTDPLSKDFVADCDNKRKFIMSKNEKFEHVDEKLKKQAEDEIDERKRQQKEEMAEQRKQAKMDKIKDGQIIVSRLKSSPVSPFDVEEVYLDNFNSVQIDDSIYFIDFKGEMDTITASQLVTGWDEDMLHDFYNYSDSAKDELLYKLKEIVHYNGCFDINVVREEMEQVRKDFTHSYNKGMPYDVDWEGDRYHDDVGMEQL